MDQTAKEQQIESLYNERTELAGAYTAAVQNGRLTDADEITAAVAKVEAKLRELDEDL